MNKRVPIAIVFLTVLIAFQSSTVQLVQASESTEPGFYPKFQYDPLNMSDIENGTLRELQREAQEQMSADSTTVYNLKWQYLDENVVGRRYRAAEGQQLHIVSKVEPLMPDVGGDEYIITIKIWLDQTIMNWIDDMKIRVDLAAQDDIDIVEGVEFKIPRLRLLRKAKFKLSLGLAEFILGMAVPEAAAIAGAGAAVALFVYENVEMGRVFTWKPDISGDRVAIKIDLNDVLRYSEIPEEDPLEIKIHVDTGGDAGYQPIMINFYAHEVNYWNFPVEVPQYEYFEWHLYNMLIPVWRKSIPDDYYYYKESTFIFSNWVGGTVAENKLQPDLHNYAFYRIIVPSPCTQLKIRIEWNSPLYADNYMVLHRFRSKAGVVHKYAPQYVAWGVYGEDYDANGDIYLYRQITLHNPTPGDYLLVVYGINNYDEETPFKGAVWYSGVEDGPVRGVYELPYRSAGISSNKKTNRYYADIGSLTAEIDQVVFALYWWDYYRASYPYHDDLDLYLRTPNGYHLGSFQNTWKNYMPHGCEGVLVDPDNLGSGQYGQWKADVYGWKVNNQDNGYMIASNYYFPYGYTRV